MENKDARIKQLEERIERMEQNLHKRKRKEKCDWCYGRGGQSTTGYGSRSVWIECENCQGTGFVEYY